LKYLVDTNYGTHRGLVRYMLGQFEGVAGKAGRFRTMHPHKVERLVFVCLGNINRSAFAHAVARQASLKCVSIGLATTTGAPATETAIAVAREFGLSLEQHQATSLKDYERLPGDLLLVMELRHAHRLVALGVPQEQIALLGHWARPIRYHIHDPHTLSTEYFRSCFASILPAVIRLGDELRSNDSPCVRP
jgi:protein-tyrosine phosphatase